VHLFAAQTIERIELASDQPFQLASAGATRTVTSAVIGTADAPAVATGQAAITVTAYFDSGASVRRTYLGRLDITANAGRLVVINEIDIESYVASVMSSEISAKWQSEALKAQAIAVRTYGLRRVATRQALTFDVTDDTTNQVYRGVDGIAPSIEAAAHATTALVLADGHTPADVWYHSACGGHTASSLEVTGVAGPAYLGGIADVDANAWAYCSSSAYYKWQNTLDVQELAKVFGVDAASVGSVAVAGRWPDGRERLVRTIINGGDSRELDGHAFYARAGSLLGYKVVPSTLFDIAKSGESYSISGRGVGHGVGMCQYGAEGRARAGQDAEAILTAYFPGTMVQKM
jgi:stage II sporulation protein D